MTHSSVSFVAYRRFRRLRQFSACIWFCILPLNNHLNATHHLWGILLHIILIQLQTRSTFLQSPSELWIDT